MSCGHHHHSDKDHHHSEHHDHSDHHHHEDHDHHHHGHGPHDAGSPSDGEKLEKMLEYWVHHNEDHARSFKEWAHRARSMDREDVGAVLEAAAEEAVRQNEKLEHALDLLRKSSEAR